MGLKAAAAEAVFERIREGRSLRQALEDFGGTPPSKTTFLRWLAADARLMSVYVRAREQGAESLEEEMQRIANDGSQDWTVDRNGQEVINHEHIQRSRLIVDTLKWRLARMHPKRYGDKVDVTSGDRPLVPTVRLRFFGQDIDL